MTDALITSLAKVRAWRVVSRTSIMRFKGTNRSLPAIAAELGADAIIEGSVIRDGDRIRITAQLIDAGTDQHLWAESYDRDFQDVFIMQSEIAKTIAQEVRIAVTPEESARLARAAEVSTDGYDAYLKGLQRFYRLTPNELETALRYFDTSLEQNPGLALAHTGVAAAWIGLQQMGFVPSSEATPKAEAAALRALEIDPDSAEAHHWLAVVRSWSDWKWEAAEELFERAIELNPSYGDARTSYSHLLAVLGRFDEALVQAELALELDPLNAWFQGIYGVDLHMIHRFDDAIATLEEAIRLSPDLPFVWFVLSGSYHYAGRFDEAVHAEGSLWAAMGETESQRLLMQQYSEHGYKKSIVWSAELAAERSDAIGASGVWVAYRYSRPGQYEKAIEWMERGFEQRDPTMPYMLMPELDNVRSDPRIQALMQKMDLL
jgi:tetratricopeptide (TPR) repeat protein